MSRRRVFCRLRLQPYPDKVSTTSPRHACTATFTLPDDLKPHLSMRYNRMHTSKSNGLASPALHADCALFAL